MQEIPDETSLAINIVGCPRHCEGCHSPHLQQEDGIPLLSAIDDVFLYRKYITCVLFMGGDWDIMSLMDAASFIKKTCPELKTALYTAMELEEIKPFLQNFDYVKTGPYIKELGGLASPTTNQRLYRILRDYKEGDRCIFVPIDMTKKEV